VAINLKGLAPNMPKANLEDYVFTIYGRGKVGKTTLFYELVKEHYNGELSKGLLVAFEKGYQALKGVYAADINSWQDYMDVVNQVILNRKELPYRLLAHDTIDVAYKMACEYVIKREKIKDSKSYTEIGDIPFGAGYGMVSDEMQKQFDRLLKAGIGIVFITHDKDKKFESRDGISYDKTTVSLPTRAREVIINMSDFVVFIDNAKIADEDGKLSDQRYIYFRADGGDIEAGSRFKNITPRINYSASGFLEVFARAVLDEVGTDTDITALQQQQADEREAQANQYIDSEKQDSPESLIETLNAKVKDLSPEARKNVSVEFKKILGGTANYTTCSDVELLQQCLEVAVKSSE
jgi:hypothetical protein